jgi:hypothetical protein
MKIIQSFWTKPCIACSTDIRKFDGGWTDTQDFWHSWALSAFKAFENYGEVELVTDSLGAEILVEGMKLPFTSVSLSLDKLDCHPGFWAYGKIYAYEQQTVPFMHIDCDVFLWKKFPNHILDADIIIQNLETTTLSWYDLIYHEPCAELIGNLTDLPECLTSYWMEKTAMNCGTFGGNNLPIIKKYCQEAKQIVESPENKDGWDKIAKKGLYHMRNFNCVIEQLLLYCSMRNNPDIFATPLFYEDEMWVKRNEKCQSLGYTHMMNSKNTFGSEPWILAMREKVQKNCPAAYEFINKFIQD